MPVHKIQLLGSPALREPAQPVEVFDDDLKQLVRDMFETMYQAQGIGLAGPQIGVSQRVVVLDVEEEGGTEANRVALVNPEVVRSTKKAAKSTEGCLSIPGAEGVVERPVSVVVEARDPGRGARPSRGGRPLLPSAPARDRPSRRHTLHRPAQPLEAPAAHQEVEEEPGGGRRVVKVLFWGTPSFALPSLRALGEEGHEVVGVVTQPDRPAGRGRRSRPSLVKEAARAEGYPVLDPELPRGDAFLESIADLDAEVSVVTAYGHILRREVLDLPPGGSINVHASLLPELRGAAPVNWAVIPRLRGHGRDDHGESSKPWTPGQSSTRKPSRSSPASAPRSCTIGSRESGPVPW